jgi:hypothetical protein
VRPQRRVEQAAIEAAAAYARANGAPAKVGIGLVLAGMVMASKASHQAQRILAEGYLEQHPDAHEAMDAWAARISAAAES